MFYSRQTVQLKPRICIPKVFNLFWIMYPRVRYPKKNGIRFQSIQLKFFSDYSHDVLPNEQR